MTLTKFLVLGLLLRDTLPLSVPPSNSCRSSMISGWRARIIGRQSNWPCKRAPSCARHCANQDLRKREEVWRLLELRLCIGPDPLEGFVTSTATIPPHGTAQTLQPRKGRPLSDGYMLWPQRNGEATTKRIERQPQTGCAVKLSGVPLKLVASERQRNRCDPVVSPKS